jgi:hypothetical protein
MTGAPSGLLRGSVRRTRASCLTHACSPARWVVVCWKVFSCYFLLFLPCLASECHSLAGWPAMALDFWSVLSSFFAQRCKPLKAAPELSHDEGVIVNDGGVAGKADAAEGAATRTDEHKVSGASGGAEMHCRIRSRMRLMPVLITHPSHRPASMRHMLLFAYRRLRAPTSRSVLTRWRTAPLACAAVATWGRMRSTLLARTCASSAQGTLTGQWQR